MFFVLLLSSIIMLGIIVRSVRGFNTHGGWWVLSGFLAFACLANGARWSMVPWIVFLLLAINANQQHDRSLLGRLNSWLQAQPGIGALAPANNFLLRRCHCVGNPPAPQQQPAPAPQQTAPLTDLDRYAQAYREAMARFHDAKAARAFAQYQLEHPPARPAAPRPNLRVYGRCPYLRFVLPCITFTYDGVEVVRTGWFGRQDSILVKNIWDVELDGPVWANLRGTQRLHFRFKAIEAGKENRAITWHCVPIEFARMASYDAKHH